MMTSRGISSRAGGHHRSTTMVPSAAAEEASTMKLKPQVDDEEKNRNKHIIIPRALQWIMAASSSSPPTLTIEEANRKSGMRRAGFWFLAVCVPPLIIHGASFIANEAYRNDHIFPRSAPWRPAAIFAWGVYMVLVVELYFFMSLFLPRAPHALRDAVHNVGVACVGVPLAWIVIPSVSLGGQTWMGVVVACVYAALFTIVIAFWVWLVRTYR